MIASLPMYARPETAAAQERFWDLVRAADGQAPALTQPSDLWQHWEAPDLYLSQTCGLPFRARLHSKVDLIGSPDHGIAGIPSGHYHSVLVVRADDSRDDFAAFHGASLALNDRLSQSGWAAPLAHAGQSGIRLTPVLQTGSHVASARAVAHGRADIAGIDVVTWTLMTRHDRWTDDLRVIAKTAPTPALPFVTARGRDAATIRAGLSHAIAALDADDRDALCLHGLVHIPARDYRAIPIPPAPQLPN